MMTISAINDKEENNIEENNLPYDNAKGYEF